MKKVKIKQSFSMIQQVKESAIRMQHTIKSICSENYKK